MAMLEAEFKEIHIKPSDSKYNNISGRYRTVIKKACAHLYMLKRLDPVEFARLEDIIQSGGKASSIECIRQVLLQPIVREYIQQELIGNGRLIMEILSDRLLKCHTKLAMMRCYPAFIRAVEQPEMFVTWRM